MKKLIMSLLFIFPAFSFAAITQQDIANFKVIYGGEIQPKTYNNILISCNDDDADMESCLKKMKAEPSKFKENQSKMAYNYCCVNVSGGWGEYAYIHGQNYCVPPC